MSTFQRILIGYAIITAVVLISDRSRTLAGILATAPINIPIILWILWGTTGNDYKSMQTVTNSMLAGIVSTACFIAVCWYGFGRRWPLAHILAAGYLAWAVAALAPLLIQWMAKPASD